jgi:hypothetical protein
MFQDASGYFVFRYILIDLPSRFFNEYKWIRMTPFSLQARKVDTRCAYLLNGQTVLERMNPW